VNRRLLALIPLLILTACGKAGAPIAPGSSFPHPYPDPKLAPTATAQPAPPEDQPGMQGDSNKTKFTAKGSYIDPNVKATELQRNAVVPGATLPYSQTLTPGSSTPFNQSLSNYGQSPLGQSPGTQSPEEEQQPQ